MLSSDKVADDDFEGLTLRSGAVKVEERDAEPIGEDGRVDSGLGVLKSLAG